MKIIIKIFKILLLFLLVITTCSYIILVNKTSQEYVNKYLKRIALKKFPELNINWSKIRFDSKLSLKVTNVSFKHKKSIELVCKDIEFVFNFKRIFITNYPILREINFNNLSAKIIVDEELFNSNNKNTFHIEKILSKIQIANANLEVVYKINNLSQSKKIFLNKCGVLITKDVFKIQSLSGITGQYEFKIGNAFYKLTSQQAELNDISIFQDKNKFTGKISYNSNSKLINISGSLLYTDFNVSGGVKYNLTSGAIEINKPGLKILPIQVATSEMIISGTGNIKKYITLDGTGKLTYKKYNALFNYSVLSDSDVINISIDKIESPDITASLTDRSNNNGISFVYNYKNMSGNYIFNFYDILINNKISKVEHLDINGSFFRNIDNNWVLNIAGLNAKIDKIILNLKHPAELLLENNNIFSGKVNLQCSEGINIEIDGRYVIDKNSANVTWKTQGISDKIIKSFFSTKINFNQIILATEGNLDFKENDLYVKSKVNIKTDSYSLKKEKIFFENINFIFNINYSNQKKEIIMTPTQFKLNSDTITITSPVKLNFKDNKYYTNNNKLFYRGADIVFNVEYVPDTFLNIHLSFSDFKFDTRLYICPDFIKPVHLSGNIIIKYDIVNNKLSFNGPFDIKNDFQYFIPFLGSTEISKSKGKIYFDTPVLKTEFNLMEININKIPYKVNRDIKVIYNLNNNEFEINGELQSENKKGKLNIALSQKNEITNINLSVSDFYLNLLDQQYIEYIDTAICLVSGVFKLSYNKTGKKVYDLYAKGTIDNASLFVKDIKQEVLGNRFNFNIVNRELLIETVDLGKTNVRGKLIYNFDTLKTSILLKTDFIIYQPHSSLTGKIKSDTIQINISRDNFQLFSNVTLKDVVFTAPVDYIITDLHTKYKTNKMYDSPLINYLVDVNITMENPLHIKTDEMDLYFNGELYFSVNDEETLISGYLELARGIYFIGGNKFNISQGRIDFTGEKFINPFIVFSGSTVINKYKIFFNISGRLHNQTITFSSEPVLSQLKIVQLLALNREVLSDNMKELLKGDLVIAGFEKILGGVKKSTEDKLSKKIGVDSLSFNIEEFMDSKVKTGVTVQKMFLPNFMVEYNKKFIKKEGSSQLKIEYQINPNLYFSTTSTTAGAHGFEFKYSKDY